MSAGLRTERATLPVTSAEEQARRMYLLAVARLRERVPDAKFPFLRDFPTDLATLGADSWRKDPTGPLHRLASATGFDLPELVELFTVALVDEDARFGAVFQAYGGHTRPPTGLLHAWWPASRAILRQMRCLGLLVTLPGATSSADECLRVPSLVWDAVRGDAPAADGPGRAAIRHRGWGEAVGIDELILPTELAGRVARLPDALASGQVGGLILRGPRASGRHQVAGAVARSLGSGLLELEPDAEDWGSAGVLATLLDAVPVVTVDPAPGEHRELPALRGFAGPLFVVTGRRGGVSGSDLRRAVTVDLAVPEPAERERHWVRALVHGLGPDPGELAGRYRMASGHIHVVAPAAEAAAMLAGRSRPSLEDVGTAVRELHRHQFDAIATRVETPDSWSAVVVAPETMRDLALAEARCRHREALPGPPGVRLLFRGPSGTGKTLAARTLAGVLGLDLYTVDLSTVVNKYIGETEKNLDRLFSRAEETGVALLLDEGDALMARRTSVETANDRYANLETNFLLQRLESFEGVLVVTTNAAGRIDRAFERRMDLVVDFGAPDAMERWWLWQLHLPAGHGVSAHLIDTLAVGCPMTGAEIRNTVVHAALLALDEDARLADQQLATAVRRELAKAGRAFPLSLGEGRA